MTDYLNIQMTEQEIGAVSNLGLAHIGDCVYELLVRSYLVCHGGQTNQGLHFATVEYVKAPAQAKAMEKGILTRADENAKEVIRHFVESLADTSTYSLNFVTQG